MGMESGKSIEYEVKIAKFKSFDHLPGIFGFSARIL